MAQIDFALQLDVAVRLIVSALLGAAIGFEREIHEHPAGMRTHLLVSFGSAAFTVVSIYGFGNPDTADPSRVAAQVVTGIGFLGAGAIIKYGTSVRGLTTAASLWATAAIGMAVGVGWWILALVGAAIVVFSLWPLNVVLKRIRGEGPHPIRVRLHAARLDAVGDVTRALSSRRVEIREINTQRHGKGSYEIELQLGVPPSLPQDELITIVSGIQDVELLESDSATD
ncbi:MAG: MgtC/SapB family protein [Chloroflexota bacterium]